MNVVATNTSAQLFLRILPGRWNVHVAKFPHAGSPRQARASSKSLRKRKGSWGASEHRNSAVSRVLKFPMMEHWEPTLGEAATSRQNRLRTHPGISNLDTIYYNIGVIWGLHWDNGTENGNYYNIFGSLPFHSFAKASLASATGALPACGSPKVHHTKR